MNDRDRGAMPVRFRPTIGNGVVLGIGIYVGYALASGAFGAASTLIGEASKLIVRVLAGIDV